MNAAARALTQSSFIAVSGRSLTFSSQMFGMMLLIVAVLASALSVVYVKNLNRQLFSELHMLKQTHEELRIESGRLSLEQNTWAASARVQALAQQQSSMVVPAPRDIVLVALPARQQDA